MYRGALHAPLAKPEAPHALVRCRQGRLLISTTQCKATDGPNQQRLHPKPASVLHSRQSAKDASNSGNSVASTAFVADVVAPIDTIVGRVRDAAVLGMAPRAVPLVEVQEDMVVVTAGDERIEVRANGALKLWRNKCPLVGDDGGDGEARLVASGNVSLPDRSKSVIDSFTVTDTYVNEHGDFSIECLWGRDELPTAVLRITSPGQMAYDWCKGLRHGFALEFDVASSTATMAEVCLDLQPSGHWFGGGHFMRQLWPLDAASWETGPYYPFDNGPNGLNTLISPQWMTSRGLLVMADPETPFLHVGMNSPAPHKRSGLSRSWGVGVQNMTREYLPLTVDGAGHHLPGDDGIGIKQSGDGMLRLQARRDYECHIMKHPLSDWKPDHLQHGEYLSVRVVLAAATDIRDACMLALRCFTPPRVAPNREILEAPIWTTWARYHSRVSQPKVLQYAQEIVDRNLQRSVMEIDDRWQSAYGDLDFDKKKFPDPAAMVSQLHNMGFKVTLWVMPFIEEASQAYKEGASKGYFVQSDRKRWFLKPGFFHWWNTQPVCALDVTNPEAVEWFVTRLRRLQDLYGIDGFKFDGGEPCFLPPGFRTHRPITHATEYTRLWVSEVAGQFQGGPCEVRTGHMTQHLSLFTRMGDRFSTWDITNGLRSIIPTVLTSGVLGYPFCLPDMIGGNCYFGQRPDKELLVRWTQLNALLPAMQFSVAPWDVSREADLFCTAALEVREKLKDVLLKLAEEAADKLKPIVRPLWWLDPHDETTYGIFDQFALGDDLIVAPVVTKGAVSRDIYLTAGTWQDVFDPSFVVQGGQYLRDFDAPLSKLPAFQRVIDVEVVGVAGGGDGVCV